MGRALMTPGFVSRNIAEWIKGQDLPRSVAPFGGSLDEIFVTYESIKAEYGDEIDRFSAGSLGVHTYSDKIRVGLQQLMSGNRNMKLSTLSRNDLTALTLEAAEISGIPFVTDA
jgi:hypothetical protein